MACYSDLGMVWNTLLGKKLSTTDDVTSVSGDLDLRSWQLQATELFSIHDNQEVRIFSPKFAIITWTAAPWFVLFVLWFSLSSLSFSSAESAALH